MLVFWSFTWCYEKSIFIFDIFTGALRQFGDGQRATQLHRGPHDLRAWTQTQRKGPRFLKDPVLFSKKLEMVIFFHPNRNFS